MKVINFFAGPCAGKSTLSAGLFYNMKVQHYNVEYVHEYAKELTWEERYNCLTDQLFVTANQNRMFERLKGKVDWIITDTSLLLSLMYVPDDYYATFEPLLVDVFNSYDNINVFVNRPATYCEIGRNQTLEEAKKIDERMLALFDRLKIPYYETNCNIDPNLLLKFLTKG